MAPGVKPRVFPVQVWLSALSRCFGGVPWSMAVKSHGIVQTGGAQLAIFSRNGGASLNTALLSGVGAMIGK